MADEQAPPAPKAPVRYAQPDLPASPDAEHKADKEYEQRRAGLRDPDPEADKRVLAVRARKAEEAVKSQIAEAARRAARVR